MQFIETNSGFVNVNRVRTNRNAKGKRYSVTVEDEALAEDTPRD
jgi:hypothetical protein